jgi:hypothetical protein
VEDAKSNNAKPNMMVFRCLQFLAISDFPEIVVSEIANVRLACFVQLLLCMPLCMFGLSGLFG